MYDVIIIGAGPAGMTAAIYTARKKLNTLVLAKESGGQMAWSSDIENYSGFTMISGAELTNKFMEHLTLLKENLEVKLGIEVVNLEKNITSFMVEDKAGRQYFAKSVLIASGRTPKHLGIPGEQELYGHGVSSCATCDGPLYKNKTVAIIGGANSALDAALSLSKFASRIIIVNRNQDLAGDLILIEKVKMLTNLRLFNNTNTTAIFGDNQVTGIEIEEFGKAKQSLPVDGVFIEIGYEPSHFYEHMTKKNEHEEIVVDENLMTSVPGIFAAGDVNNLWGQQIVIAAGEGAKAALSVSDYLQKLK